MRAGEDKRGNKGREKVVGEGRHMWTVDKLFSVFRKKLLEINEI